MIYAVIDENGLVTNRIELDPANEAEFAKASRLTIVADPDMRSQMGGTWNGTSFSDPSPPPPQPETAAQKLRQLTPEQVDALLALIK